MSWLAITEDHLLTRVSGAELDALRDAALAVGQDDPIAEIIATVTREVRGYVKACASNSLGADGMIPDELLGAALDRIVWEIMKRPAATIIDADSARKDANAAAIALFKDVAACRFELEQPDGATAANTGTAAINPPASHPNFGGL
jgi:hypothetical protein